MAYSCPSLSVSLFLPSSFSSITDRPNLCCYNFLASNRRDSGRSGFGRSLRPHRGNLSGVLHQETQALKTRSVTPFLESETAQAAPPQTRKPTPLVKRSQPTPTPRGIRPLWRRRELPTWGTPSLLRGRTAAIHGVEPASSSAPVAISGRTQFDDGYDEFYGLLKFGLMFVGTGWGDIPPAMTSL